MSQQDDKRRRADYTLEFKLQAVRLVKGGHMELARLRAELARVKMERDTLKSDGVLRDGIAVSTPGSTSSSRCGR